MDQKYIDKQSFISQEQVLFYRWYITDKWLKKSHSKNDTSTPTTIKHPTQTESNFTEW